MMPKNRSTLVQWLLITVVTAFAGLSTVFLSPATAQEGSPSGSWVGAVLLHEEPQVVFVEIAEDLAASQMLLPGETRFRAWSDVQWDGEQLHFRIDGENGPMLFAGQRLGEGFAGFVEQDGNSGRYYMAPLATIDMEQYDELIARYVLADGRPIVVSRGDGAGQLFYQDGDEQVRLYPVAGGRFFSSQGDLVIVERDDQGKVASLALRRALFPEMSSQGVAVRDRPYLEEDVRIETEDGELAGTLFLPEGEGPFPALLLLHGAGAGERHFYRIFADRFAGLGFATLISDRRGSGRSLDDSELSLSELAADAEAWLTFLAGHELVAANQVGLWGISQGGLLAPLVADSAEDVAFIVAVAAPGMSINALELWRWDKEQAAGYPEMARELGLKIHRVRQDWVRLITSGANGGHIDPAPHWEGFDRPVLLIYGEDDQIVPPAESAALVLKALAAGGGQDPLAFILPQANHNLMTIDQGDGARYAAGYLALVDDWLRERASGGARFEATAGAMPFDDLAAGAEFAADGRYGPPPWYGRSLIQGLLYTLMLPAFVFTLFGSMAALIERQKIGPLLKNRSSRAEMGAFAASLLASLSLLTFAVLAWQITGGDASIVWRPLVILDLLAVAAILVYLVLLALAWSHSSWSNGRRARHVLTLAASISFLVFSLYWGIL